MGVCDRDRRVLRAVSSVCGDIFCKRLYALRRGDKLIVCITQTLGARFETCGDVTRVGPLLNRATLNIRKEMLCYIFSYPCAQPSQFVGGRGEQFLCIAVSLQAPPNAHIATC